MDSIDLDIKNKEYDPKEVLLNFDNWENSNEFKFNNDKTFFPTNTSVSSPKIAVIWQTTSDLNILNKLYMPCIGSKLSQTVQRDKSMIATTRKLEEVHADL